MTIRAHQRIPAGLEDLAQALHSRIEHDNPEIGLVFVADRTIGGEWEDVRAELRIAFDLTQAAVTAGAPVVYLVRHLDLLGAGRRRGPG